MNFDTGVISASSLSIGGSPEAPAARATSTAVRARTPSRLIVISSLRVVARPPAGPLDGPPPPLDPGPARARVEHRREAPLERPAARELVERAPQAGAEAPPGPAAPRRPLDHPRTQHRSAHHVRPALA